MAEDASSSSSEEEGEWPLGHLAPALLQEGEAEAARRAAALAQRDALSGRSWSVSADATSVMVAGQRLRLEQRLGQQQMVVWDCAVVLARFMEAHPELVAGRAVVELGCGIGLPGMASACLGARRVALTERAVALQSIQRHVELNAALWPAKGCESVDARALSWEMPPQLAREAAGGAAFDVVLCSDLIYAGDSATTAQLVATIDALAAADALVISCWEVRHVAVGGVAGPACSSSSTREEELFARLCADRGFQRREMPVSALNAACRDPTIKVALLWRGAPGPASALLAESGSEQQRQE